jgi:hypothetical protein
MPTSIGATLILLLMRLASDSMHCGSAHRSAELIGELRKAIVPHLNNEPAPGRRQHLLSPILFPIEDGTPTDPIQ